MAFWGIELKPGEPYSLDYFCSDRRLHLSQATLGSGTSSKKTIVQCSVGDKIPIYLCSLLPEKLETCALNLEFDEDEKVMFSVIGPYSVHLSGFFIGEDEDSDPYREPGETESESEEPSDYDTDDEDEDDFIDYDDDLDMYPSSSPIHKSGVKIEEIVDDEMQMEDAKSRQTKKKNKKRESNNNESSGKQLVVRGTSVIPELESEDEDGFPISSPAKRKTDDLTSRVTADGTGDENTGKEAQQKKGKDYFGPSRNLKRKIDNVGQDGEQSREIDAVPGKDAKQKKENKKKKTVNKEEIANEADSKSSVSKEAKAGDMEQKPAAEMRNDAKPTSEKEKEKEKKNKKKNKKKKQESVIGSDEQTITDKSGSKMEVKEKAEAKPFQVRSFPNGLVIEELAMGKPDGKKAAPGKKVSVHYIGKLKKDGKIFDSNIGRAPFKFRLGIGQVIKGWDVGVNGMRVGDKRRLTIPPAMGYGARGAGGAIPPNSWLVFDVELVDEISQVDARDESIFS
ncbi:hypothetical protein ACH5RR_017021 [Cinchona calisaya]|uniref:peptidylprolyl isomerase n=1 Tax=Cinchona calisaya TaxID=153742 RepID=A0ABD2ZXP1_9GENT